MCVVGYLLAEWNVAHRQYSSTELHVGGGVRLAQINVRHPESEKEKTQMVTDTDQNGFSARKHHKHIRFSVSVMASAI